MMKFMISCKGKFQRDFAGRVSSLQIKVRGIDVFKNKFEG